MSTSDNCARWVHEPGRVTKWLHASGFSFRSVYGNNITNEQWCVCDARRMTKQTGNPYIVKHKKDKGYNCVAVCLNDR